MKQFLGLAIATCIISSSAFAAEGHSHGGHSSNSGGHDHHGHGSHNADWPGWHTHHSHQDGLRLGGTIDFITAFRSQDVEEEGSTRNVVFNNDTEIHITYGNTLGLLRYGAVVELEADVSAASRSEGMNADKTFIYLETDYFGRLELGSNADAGHAMGIDASSIAVATGGVHGDYDLYAHLPEDEHAHGGGGGHHGHIPVIHSPTLPLAHEHGAAEDAVKITYYTPRIFGLQLGASFIPDSGNAGSTPGFTTDMDEEQFENVFNVGANYQQQIDQHLSFAVSAIGEFGDHEEAGHEDLAAYAFGASVTFDNTSVAGSYGNWGETDYATGSTLDDAYYWSIGASHYWGPFGFSIGYLDSEVQENELSVVSIGAEHSFAPGIVPFVEVNFFEIDAADVDIEDNDGTVVLVGSRLHF